jgi:hypothetical protein
VTVTAGHATTVTHERPPAAWDTKPEAHQGDVPTSRTDTQNVFLCRDPIADVADQLVDNRGQPNIRVGQCGLGA